MKITKTRIAITAAATVASLALPLAAIASFGPDRQTYVCGQAGICQGADHVQFDSFTNNPNYDQHDERNFLTIRPAAGGAYTDSISLTDGGEYVVRAYVHNNADPALAETPAAYTAENTTFKVSLPGEVNGSSVATGTISASNAQPGSVYDTVTLNSGEKLNLNYVAGSAKWTSNGASNGAALSDSILTNGALVGYDSLNGELPGCFGFSGYVSFKVKASKTVTPPVVTPPAALPQTGGEAAGLAGVAGTGIVGYAAMAYRRSKRSLADALRNK